MDGEELGARLAEKMDQASARDQRMLRLEHALRLLVGVLRGGSIIHERESIEILEALDPGKNG